MKSGPEFCEGKARAYSPRLVHSGFGDHSEAKQANKAKPKNPKCCCRNHAHLIFALLLYCPKDEWLKEDRATTYSYVACQAELQPGDLPWTLKLRGVHGFHPLPSSFSKSFIHPSCAAHLELCLLTTTGNRTEGMAGISRGGCCACLLSNGAGEFKWCCPE